MLPAAFFVVQTGGGKLAGISIPISAIDNITSVLDNIASRADDLYNRFSYGGQTATQAFSGAKQAADSVAESTNIASNAAEAFAEKLNSGGQAAESAFSTASEAAEEAGSASNIAAGAVGELSDSLNAGGKAAEEAAAGMEDLGKGADDAGRGLEDAGSNAKDAAQSLQEIAAAIGVAKVLHEIGQALMEAADAAMIFEVQMAKVSTLADESVVSLGQMGTDIRQIAETMGESANDIAESAYDALSSDIATADIRDFVTEATKLAKGGFTESATAVDILTTAINAYKLETSDAERVSSMLIKTQDLGRNIAPLCRKRTSDKRVKIGKLSAVA